MKKALITLSMVILLTAVVFFGSTTSYAADATSETETESIQTYGFGDGDYPETH